MMRLLGSVVLLLGLPAAVAAGAASHSVPVAVHPRVGGPRTRFIASFRAPAASGTYGGTSRHYQVSATLSGRAHGHCVASLTVPVGSVAQGQRVRVALKPRGRWCAGRFAGRVQEIIAPQCERGQMCPLFLALQTVGHFAFRVR